MVGQDIPSYLLMKSFMNFIQKEDPDEKVKPVFLLAGNPGHGKTFIAENLVTNLGLPSFKVNCSSISDNHTLYLEVLLHIEVLKHL